MSWVKPSRLFRFDLQPGASRLTSLPVTEQSGNICNGHIDHRCPGGSLYRAHFLQVPPPYTDAGRNQCPATPRRSKGSHRDQETPTRRIHPRRFDPVAPYTLGSHSRESGAAKSQTEMVVQILLPGAVNDGVRWCAQHGRLSGRPCAKMKHKHLEHGEACTNLGAPHLLIRWIRRSPEVRRTGGKWFDFMVDRLINRIFARHQLALAFRWTRPSAYPFPPGVIPRPYRRQPVLATLLASTLH